MYEFDGVMCDLLMLMYGALSGLILSLSLDNWYMYDDVFISDLLNKIISHVRGKNHMGPLVKKGNWAMFTLAPLTRVGVDLYCLE